MDKPVEKSYPNIAQSFGIAGIVTLGLIVMIPVYIIMLNSIKNNELSLLIYYVLAIGISFWVVFYIRKKKIGYNSYNLKIENKRLIPLAILGTIALLFGVISPIASLIPMPESFKKMFMEFLNQKGVFTFLAMVIAAPVLEEFIFRGIVLDGLLKKYSPVKSIVISSLLFGLVHLNPWQFVSAFIFGSFSGWIYYRTRSLLLTIIIHATANLTVFLMRFMSEVDSMMDKSLLEEYGGLKNLILILSGLIVIAIVCIYFLQKEFNKASMHFNSELT